MSQHTDNDDFLKSELDSLYSQKVEPEPPTPRAWELTEALKLIGFSYENENFIYIGDGSYGYYIVLCSESDSIVERGLKKLGFEQQHCEDIWVKNSSVDQFSNAKMIGIFSELIDELISELVERYSRICELSKILCTESAVPLTSKTFTIYPRLKKASIEDTNISNFLSLLYTSFCEPFKILGKELKINLSQPNIFSDINKLRHRFSGHDFEIPLDNKETPQQKLKKTEIALRRYTNSPSLTSKIDVLIFKYNLLRSLNLCLRDVCDFIDRIPIEG